MKKKLLVLVVLVSGYYYFQVNDTKAPLSVSELISNSSSRNGKVIQVNGEVKSNFKLIYSIYELKDAKTGESIMVSNKVELPKIGTTISRKLRRNDIITLNDKTFSLFEEIE